MNVLGVLAMLMVFVPTVQEHTHVLVNKDMMEMGKSDVMVCIILWYNIVQNSLSTLCVFGTFLSEKLTKKD